MMNDLLKILQAVSLAIPTLAGIVQHYSELANSESLPLEDREKAVKMLEALKLPDWKDIP